jgi:gamma-glutamylcyclotransferase
MLYFAQGSYIDRPQMLLCCPGADFIAQGRLNDYRLCFPRWSRVRNSAVAGIEPAKGEITWGVLYELTARDLQRLDLVEGYAEGRGMELNASQRVAVRVERPDGLTVQAETHVPIPMADPGRPTQGYLRLLARAAAELGFPNDFIAKLKAAEEAPLAA